MSHSTGPEAPIPSLGGATAERPPHSRGSLPTFAHSTSPHDAATTAYLSYPAAPYSRQPQPGYPPSFPMYMGDTNGGSLGNHAATAASSLAPSGSYGFAAVTSPSPAYPEYGGYSQQQQHVALTPPQPPPPPHQQRNTNAYIPREAAREEVVDEAIAATSQHWLQTQLKRETERRYEQLYGKVQQPAHRGHEGQNDDDGYARENAARHLSTAGAAAARGGTASLISSRAAQRQHVEFLIGSPCHVKRLVLLFLSTLFGVLPLMSTFAFTTLLCGVVLLYISDYLCYHRTTVLVLLGTAGVFSATLLLSNIHAAATSFGPMLMIADLGGVLMVVVAAAIQHFRWVQETFPNVLCALERFVFAVGPVLCLPPLLTTITGLVGSRRAPVFFFVALCTLHHFFYCPLKSSFLVLVSPESAAGAAAALVQPDQQHQHLESDAMGDAGAHARRRVVGDGDGQAKAAHAGGDGAGGVDDGASVDSTSSACGAPMQLNEQVEALVFSCLVLFLPVAVYNAFQSNWVDHAIANTLNSVGLVCGGIAYFCISPLHSLWFLASPPEETYSLLQQLEYDPLGLLDLVAAFRIPVLATVSIVGVHWGAYRLLNSRYSYLFSGVAFPFNAILLLIAFYIAVYVGIEIKWLLDVDSRGGDVTKGKYLLRRMPVLLGSCAVSVILCVLTSAPGVLYLPSVLSIIAFNVFLMDRTNGGPMFTFTVFTSLMLLWWMYRTYSFIVMDLRVFGETTVVPTPVLGVSVLWCYVLGCMSFTLSFSPSKTPVTIALFLLALQLTFVEHVLYSQKEEGAYPAVLVVLTSAVGVAVPCRMYRNGALTVYSAVLIASCFVAKFFTFLVEVTSAYYAAELTVRDGMETARAWLLMAEITGGWWIALFAGYLVASFEIEHRRRIKMEAARRMLYTYATLALLLSLLTIRNVQRAAYEFVTQSYVAESELLHIAAGTCCATYALLTMPVWWRLKSRYPAVFPLRAVSRCAALLGVVLLALQPTRVVGAEVSDFDYDFEYADRGRYAATVGLIMVLGARVSFLHCIPFAGRFVYWLATAALLSLGITGLVQAAPTFNFYIMMLGFVFLILLMIDVAHYREVSGTVLIGVYGLSILTIPLSFLQLNRSVAAQQGKLRYSPNRLMMLWDMYEQGSLRLLAVIVVMHLGLSVMINCRLRGRPLLPKCREISHEASLPLGVIANFSTELSVALLCAINFFGNDSEPALYVLSSLLLLLFVDDEVIFFGLKEHHFRYFAPTACSLTLLWLCTMWNAWRTAAPQGLLSQLRWETWSLVQASVTLPAQISLLVLLWKGRKMGSSPGFVVIGSVLLNLVCLLLVSDKAVQWMAIVGIFGQCARIFETHLQPTTTSTRRRHHSAY
ncbi:conserved hypothetical protein [Leishmania mexicana MHOM/GT/2001/U1103]|uniref:Transmembrane protein n=1 Tax=Leishmania mexicana (strain MHOM/GT/2001/U1103) TaxID=929439 RepID=E9B359_LEIMU|nr:conserved hypothetical protein [Leishmania mexicana MHOM/GT/2001/U1103]CBZ29675.1 conserved hypothetical protein [Leishmania mexicana MHOM/GT/2001/U1103]